MKFTNIWLTEIDTRGKNCGLYDFCMYLKHIFGVISNLELGSHQVRVTLKGLLCFRYSVREMPFKDLLVLRVYFPGRDN